MARSGPRRSLRAPVLLKNVRREKSPSPEPFTVPTYATSSTTQYTTPNFSTRTRPPITAPNHSSSSTQLPPSSTSTKPTNALTSAITNRKTIEEKHQEALAKKRKRDTEAQEEYRSLEDGLKKYRYTGGDPRVDWDAIRGEAGRVEGELGRSDKEGSGRADEAHSRKKRGERGRKTEGGNTELEAQRDVQRPEHDPRSESSGRRESPEPLVQLSLEVDVGSEEEDDDQFDQILASKKRSGKRTHRLLSPTIKPFRPISKPIEDTAQHKQYAKPTYTAQARLTAPRIAHSHHLGKTTQQGNNSGIPGKEEAARRRRAAVEKEEAARRRRSAMARTTTMTQPKDEYGDDAFDNLLGSATEFDDGTDIYADGGFDNMLAQALASGQDFV